MNDVTRSSQQWAGDRRFGGLWRFAVAISVLNLLGYTVLGFEQAWAHPFVALLVTYSTELLLETLDARATARPPRWSGSIRKVVEFFLPAHITGLAVSMLLYAGERFWIVAFAAAAAIVSKYLFVVPTGAPLAGSTIAARRHFLNPSNFGITITLLLFPSVGIAPPYQFTENVRGPLDVILPLLIVVSGTALNVRFTGKIPLILAWLTGFTVQAILRSLLFGTPLLVGLVPMTGMSFILFTFYMVTDPATTPSRPRAQVLFGASVAAVYGVLMANHVVFGLFFALTVVTLFRGANVYAFALRASTRSAAKSPHATAAGRTT